MADPLARAIATEALALRASHAHAPVIDIFDLVMRGRDHRHIVFADLADPPHPFALLIAEGFVTPNEWAGMLAHCDPSQYAGRGVAHARVGSV